MPDQADRLRVLTDAELAAIVDEAKERGVDPKTRSIINDELRRRKWSELPPRRGWDW